MSQTQRQIRDKQLEVVTSNPAQNTNVDSDSLDLVLAGNVIRESMELVIAADAVPNLANGQTLTITVQDSADDVTFTAVPQLKTVVQTGGGGVGAAAASQRFALPSTIRRYVNINIAASVTAGDNTAKGVTAYLAF